ncbi:MAG: glycosyltransferase family 2 protein [Lachnospiraceae bacterium]|nr:glycosyltransferase family 2 protein [Lachnospiraceae bacterium]
MKGKKVSVVMPAYNCAAYIEQAVQSVQKQQVDWELIIVDDASTDMTETVVKSYLADERIQYYRNKQNMGVSYSRNLGVSKAAGKYVAYLDADDWWEEDKLEKQVALMEEKQAVLCYTGRELFRDDGTALKKQLHVKETVSYTELLRGNVIACSSVLMKREAAQEFPMSHDEYHEDYMTWLLCLKKYGQACGIDEPLLCYRLSQEGKSRNRIKSAYMTYGMHRLMGKNAVQALYYTGCHLINAVRKYK